MRLRIVISFVLVFIFLTGCSFKASTYGLKPEYPENRRGGPSYHPHEILFLEVDSLQPIFRWESLPRPYDFEADKQGMLSKIKNVTYDLKVWRSKDDYPETLIYFKQGLPEPIHKTETPLRSCSKYFWTVRARFELDGQVRVTEWGNSKTGVWKGQVCTISPRWPSIPNPHLYRFKTPCH